MDTVKRLTRQWSVDRLVHLNSIILIRHEYAQCPSYYGMVLTVGMHNMVH